MSTWRQRSVAFALGPVVNLVSLCSLLYFFTLDGDTEHSETYEEFATRLMAYTHITKQFPKASLTALAYTTICADIQTCVIELRAQALAEEAESESLSGKDIDCDRISSVASAINKSHWIQHQYQTKYYVVAVRKLLKGRANDEERRPPR